MSKTLPTPKEKAEELIRFFSKIALPDDIVVGVSKEFASRVCHESICVAGTYQDIHFWQDVQTEINKLP